MLSAPTNFRFDTPTWDQLIGFWRVVFHWDYEGDTPQGFYLEREQPNDWAGLVDIAPDGRSASYSQGFSGNRHKPDTQTYRVVAYNGPNAGPISTWDEVVPSNAQTIKTPVK